MSLTIKRRKLNKTAIVKEVKNVEVTKVGENEDINWDVAATTKKIRKIYMFLEDQVLQFKVWYPYWDETKTYYSEKKNGL